MQIELKVIKNNIAGDTIILILKNTEKYENHIKINNDYFVDVDELIRALRVLKKTIISK